MASGQEKRDVQRLEHSAPVRDALVADLWPEKGANRRGSSGGRLDRLVCKALLGIVVLWIPACAATRVACGQAPGLDERQSVWVTPAGESFPYRQWQPRPESRAPTSIVIGVHGLGGAVVDHARLAEQLSRSGHAFYGYELRGLGNDPVKDRVGDIPRAEAWMEDLWAFHRVVARKHPGVPVVWLGESLGSLIACAAVVRPPNDAPPPSALILASPVPSFDERVSVWQRQLIGLAALTDPKRKIPLAEWAGPQDPAWQTTGGSSHLLQMEHTPWAVGAFTVRFYNTVSILVGRMMPQARKIRQPVLVLRPAKDSFTSTAAVESFASRLARGKLLIYPGSHHLLFYDHESARVRHDILTWLESKPWA